ncbi:MAG: FmdB family zinc ribbon protein [Panacagrimonas sp.]
MPLYEYSCGACGTVSEINHRMSDTAPTDCPVCGAPELSKQISAAGFRLKGAGWYETDFKSDGKKNLAGDSGGDAKPASDGKTETKAEAKPKTETKADSKPATTTAPSSGGTPAASP